MQLPSSEYANTPPGGPARQSKAENLGPPAFHEYNRLPRGYGLTDSDILYGLGVEMASSNMPHVLRAGSSALIESTVFAPKRSASSIDRLENGKRTGDLAVIDTARTLGIQASETFFAEAESGKLPLLAAETQAMETRYESRLPINAFKDMICGELTEQTKTELQADLMAMSRLILKVFDPEKEEVYPRSLERLVSKVLISLSCLQTTNIVALPAPTRASRRFSKGFNSVNMGTLEGESVTPERHTYDIVLATYGPEGRLQPATQLCLLTGGKIPNQPPHTIILDTRADLRLTPTRTFDLLRNLTRQKNGLSQTGDIAGIVSRRLAGRGHSFIKPVVTPAYTHASGKAA